MLIIVTSTMYSLLINEDHGICSTRKIIVSYVLTSIVIFFIVNNELRELAGAISGHVIEYTTDGIVTAVISVTDIHRWKS